MYSIYIKGIIAPNLTKIEKNEPVKYHFTIDPYLCTQKNQSRYG